VLKGSKKLLIYILGNIRTSPDCGFAGRIPPSMPFIKYDNFGSLMEVYQTIHSSSGLLENHAYLHKSRFLRKEQDIFLVSKYSIDRDRLKRYVCAIALF